MIWYCENKRTMSYYPEVIGMSNKDGSNIKKT